MNITELLDFLDSAKYVRVKSGRIYVWFGGRSCVHVLEEVSPETWEAVDAWSYPENISREKKLEDINLTIDDME